MYRYLMPLFLAASVILPCRAAAQSGWQPIQPGEAGFDAAKLEALERDLAERRTTVLLIVRRGKIVC